jgi:AcrR family transcriptional regulator
MARDTTETREAMLDAVAELIAEVGVRELSLREVARRAGVSHATPGHHFGDKDGMLAAFAERGFRLFADTFASKDEGMLDGTAYIEFAVDHQPYFDVMFRSGLDRSQHPGLDRGSAAVFESLVSALEEAQEQGIATGYPARVIAIRLWALAHGLATLRLDGQLSRVVPDEDLDEVMRMALEADV